MPHFEITKLDPNVDAKSFDIWADQAATVIDISKLNNYIEILIDIQTIVSNKDEKYNRHIYKTFRKCELTDFTDKGFPAEDAFKSIVNSLLCPDLSESPEQFMVEGKYTN